MVMSISGLSVDEIDRLLAEKIAKLPHDKKALLLEWVKKEFPEVFRK